MRSLPILLVAAVSPAAACGHKATTIPEVPDPGAGAPALVVTSTAFAPDGEIPKVYTCEGDETPPPLAWSGAPAGTKSYALVVDDPDAPDPAAPTTVFVHWVVADIPPSVTSFGGNADGPSGAIAGKNDKGNARYNGPGPPVGRHRYFFKVYALDTDKIGKPNITKPQLLEAMTGHVLAKGELIGTYQKK